MTPKAVRELREWICSILGDAANETRISEITDLVRRHWEYIPEWLESDDGCGLDLGWEEDDSIDSWDQDSSTGPRLNFCGFVVDEDLAGTVYGLVDKALEEHESAIRFYGLDSRAPKAVVCHCGKLRGAAPSSAETMPTDRHLMLIRDPPSWDSVYGLNAPLPRRIRLATKPSLSESSNLNPDRSGAQAKKSTQEILGMIAQRRSLSNATVPSSLSPIPSVSKNPFRKNSTGALVRGELKNPCREHRDSAPGETSGRTPSGPTPKRMKTISQIPVPLRPTPPAMSQLARAKTDGTLGILQKKPGKLKQATLMESFGKLT